MGKPRMIILVRHAQSEGNSNREIHQYIPDHRVQLTTLGRQQAEEAGRRLRSILRPDDKLQFFTSPYRRTRETTEGILRTLTCDDDELGPSPFQRHQLKVYEEPRLREQDFGNFQPCSVAMERMWQERADYGHFFYRIPNGESAADAYDRVSGFNESLWRQISEPAFPSVCVLVTHGLMTRIFLMKWYHWSVEYFEDLRNVNHCEFIIMKLNEDNGKYELQNELRTWSELNHRAAAVATAASSSSPEASAKSPTTNGATTNTTTTITTTTAAATAAASPQLLMRRWGGCAMGCDHDKMNFPRRTQRKSTMDFTQSPINRPEMDDHPIALHEADHNMGTNSRVKSYSKLSRNDRKPLETVSSADESISPTDDKGIQADEDSVEEDSIEEVDPKIWSPTAGRVHQVLLSAGRSSERSKPGFGSPADVSDDSDYFDTNVHQLHARSSVPYRSSVSRSALAQVQERSDSSSPRRTGSPASRKHEDGKSSGRMGSLASPKTMKRADALGDVETDDAQEGSVASDIY